jgi:hypothetical protein
MKAEERHLWVHNDSNGHSIVHDRTAMERRLLPNDVSIGVERETMHPRLFVAKTSNAMENDRNYCEL